MRTSPRPEEAPCPRRRGVHVSRVPRSDNGEAASRRSHNTVPVTHGNIGQALVKCGVYWQNEHYRDFFRKLLCCARGTVAPRVSPRVPCYGCVSILMCVCRGPGPTWPRHHASSRQSPGAAVTILSRVPLFLHQYYWEYTTFGNGAYQPSPTSSFSLFKALARQHIFIIEIIAD